MIRALTCAVLIVGGAPLSAGVYGSQRLLTDADIAAWSEQHGNALLSPDGQWLVFIWSAYDGTGDTPRQSPPQLVIKNIANKKERRHSLQGLSKELTQLKMSPSGRWIAYTQAGSTAGSVGVVLMELGSGHTKEYPNTRNFYFTGKERQEWIVLSGASNSTAEDKVDNGSVLTLHRLGDQAGDYHRPAVTQYAFAADRTLLAWADPSGLYVQDLNSNEARTLHNVARQPYSTLSWSPSGNSLAVLSGTAMGTLEIFSGFASGAIASTTLDPGQTQGFPQGYEITRSAQTGSERSTLNGKLLLWRDAEDGVFFNLQRRQVVTQEPVPNLVLWHWRDEQIPPQKEYAEKRLRWREQYLAYFSLPQKRFMRLADESVSTVTPQRRGRYVLGYNWRAYGWPNYAGYGMGTFQIRDYVLLDLATGEQRTIVRGLRTIHQANYYRNLLPPQLSPDGSVVIYQDEDQNFQAYDVASGGRRNMTAGVPVQFDYTRSVPWKKDGETRGKGVNFPILQGWTSDGRHILVSDGYDVWALPLKGGQAVNLTGNGRSSGIMYIDTAPFAANRSGPEAAPFAAVRSDHELSAAAVTYDRDRIVDLSKPLDFVISDLPYIRTGLARVMPGEKHARVLTWENAWVSYYKAEHAPVYVALRTTTAGQDYYLLDKQWRARQRLTDLYAQQREFRWTQPRLLSFKTQNGTIAHGTLFTPMSGEPSGAHPAIVMVYEANPGAMHYLNDLRYGMGNQIFHWLRKGYAVVLPDIWPEVDEAAATAVEFVTAAVDAAVATGMVDRSRLGLTGHSYGGYETFAIVTQTNLFKAAIPVSGSSNLLSFYGNLMNLEPASQFLDKSQPYLSGPWWTNWDAYVRNSPLLHAQDIHTPLLIIHGDADTTIPFAQSLEMFNTLRRMGKSPAVMLQYMNEGHGSSLEELPDVKQRMSQFFDYFVRGEPEPKWWSEGLSYYQGTAPAAGTP